MIWTTFSRSNTSTHPFSSRALLAVFCGIAFYVIGYLILAPSIGSEADTLAVVPVIMIGWLWGWRAGIVAGFLTTPLNVIFLTISGRSGLEIINGLDDLLGIAQIMLVGGLIGYSRDLNMRVNLELVARQRVEAELREHRDHLEQVVRTRTAELQQANQRLQQTLVREQELNELKSRFVGMVSHEYRSPLTSILSAVGILRRYEVKITETQKLAIFKKVEDTVERMTQMLDDVLGFNKFEEDTGEVTLTPVNITAFCQAVMQNAQTALHASQTFTFSSSAGGSQSLMDQGMLQQAVTNLISNAVKYSPADSAISVDVNLQNGHFVICVRDEGMGIPSAEQVHIFDPFYRAQNVENIAGTGLGLVMSKHAVERHGGTLTFESVLNKGSIFTITIPPLASGASPTKTPVVSASY